MLVAASAFLAVTSVTAAVSTVTCYVASCRFGATVTSVTAAVSTATCYVASCRFGAIVTSVTPAVSTVPPAILHTPVTPPFHASFHPRSCWHSVTTRVDETRPTPVTSRTSSPASSWTALNRRQPRTSSPEPMGAERPLSSPAGCSAAAGGAIPRTKEGLSGGWDAAAGGVS
ncbi:unnamed protein product [Ectocarpus sp. 8 AP-2014]